MSQIILKYPNVVTYFWQYTGQEEHLILPDGIKEIPDFAFRDCKNLKSIVMSDSIEVIGGGAFLGCTSLESVKAGRQLREIKAYAFCACSNLSSFETNRKLRFIGKGAFGGTKIKRIKICSPKYIGKNLNITFEK